MADTIIALSSGAMPSGVAVVRVSGPRSGALTEALIGALPDPRHATLRVLRDSAGAEIDRGLVLWFPGPASFTGEDCAEFHVHGGRAVVDRLLAVAVEHEGVRLAEPGEFSRRAFVNGKLDLVEAEALSDLILAETEAQRRFAVEQATGAQSQLYANWRERLLTARAMIEAEIDFSDEEDVPGSVSDEVWADVSSLVAEIDQHIASSDRGRILRSGFDVALVGAPNAGKSTLLNVLAGSERAIVSAEPGTTRDIVEARLDLDGYLVTIADTAGLRETDGLVEAEGVRRARLRAGQADLVLHVSETGAFNDLSLGDGRTIWRVRTKTDLVRGDADGDADFALSSVSGSGVDDLVGAIRSEVGRRAGQTDTLAPGRARHIELLRTGRTYLIDSLSERLPLELRAEALRLAADTLGRITGRIDVEEMLGAVFSRFCVGK
ncbi:tRNA uridine-5-carboxymethylaminomethyl(34) synthesis GTPase MnmE [Roseitalea porphyridii]|uniref:tRNA modification GTPase MnmE n=1 Tax=Roseitalea porphyridii TaxID=1852022 RepID=A0A4P6UVU2_9HYPH|nr:tRNA uridine-5-carboxymethylaminomethyl(34) synthesis GTPase MnmE [Roseitalea porphyridii]QBK29261.1 tRNA uridine-5-carboxymethylaminomethyl(34) synthesis GTPase MnmE [Roseitalea porphyridii]